MDFSNLAFSGEVSALLAAFLWAFASHFFDRVGKQIRPVELNLIKGILALLFLSATWLFTKDSFAALSSDVLILFILSGIVGIGFGDTLFFKSMEHLGPRKALLILTLSPAMSALIAQLFLHEALSLRAWMGIAITIAGVAWVITEQSQAKMNISRAMFKGVQFGLLGSLFQAIGAVFSRAALAQTSATSLQSTTVRITTGVIAISIWILLARIPVGKWIKMQGIKSTASQLITATFLGTYLGMWLQQNAFKFSQVGIATTLSSTSPIFILPFSIWIKEHLSLRAILGAFIAVGGITLLFLA